MQQGDIGAPISFSLVTGPEAWPIPDGSTVELWIKHPSQRLLLRTFEIVDFVLGQVYYETVRGDLAEWGPYRFQARVLTPDGRSVSFSPVDDVVGRNLFPARVQILVEPEAAALRLGAPVEALT